MRLIFLQSVDADLAGGICLQGYRARFYQALCYIFGWSYC